MILIRNLSAALECDKQLMSQQRLRWPWSGADNLRRRYAASVIRKMEKFCQKCFSLRRSLIFVVKDTFTKGFTNASLRRFCFLFVPCL